MKTYESKEELKAEIQRSLDTYLAEFDAIPESCKDTRVPDADRTPLRPLGHSEPRSANGKRRRCKFLAGCAIVGSATAEIMVY